MGFEHLLFTQVGNLRIAYRAAGNMDAPPVVLLHALGATGEDWEPVVDALAEDHRVIAPDARGHGDSDWAENYSLELLRDDALGLLEALQLNEVALIGHSFGGTVAVLAAEARPPRLARLIIEDASIPSAADPPASARPKSDPRPGLDPKLSTALGIQIDAPDPSWWEGSANIAVPTLFVMGGPESHIPQARIAALAAHVPDAQSAVIPAGHRIHTSQPAEFVQVVRSFLGNQR